MTKRLQKAEWDKVAKWWDEEAGEQGVWHQQYDIDPVMFKLLGRIKELKLFPGAIKEKILNLWKINLKTKE